MLKVNFQKQINSANGLRNLSIDASIPLNSITGVYGNSGEGKSTLLNMVSGIDHPDNGTISYNQEVWVEAGLTKVNTQQRNIGYIFQENNLFPHFTVEENILFALPKESRKSYDLKELLAQVGISNLKNRYPHQLSGGQNQRVALARAIAQQARLILLDEPFSALDLEMKKKIFQPIKNFKNKFDLTLLIISHDVNDLYNLCDQVLWIREHSGSELISTIEFKKQITKEYL